jgi:hypothetical protein
VVAPASDPRGNPRSRRPDLLLPSPPEGVARKSPCDVGGNGPFSLSLEARRHGPGAARRWGGWLDGGMEHGGMACVGTPHGVALSCCGGAAASRRPIFGRLGLRGWRRSGGQHIDGRKRWTSPYSAVVPLWWRLADLGLSRAF